MTPTDVLRARLRKLLDERAPEGGSAADTKFADDDLDELLAEASNVFGAASMGWIAKAAMLQSEMGDAESLTLGQESERLVSLKDRLEYALRMADTYAAMAKAQGPGSMFLRLQRPEVL